MTLADRIHLLRGDITTVDVDVIVNAANSSLLSGGGVDGAIHDAAGPELLAECLRIRKTLARGILPAGEAVLTPGFNLRARHIVHCVGPVYSEHHENAWPLLSSCYANAIRLARTVDARIIAFPSIGTGAFACPLDRAAEVAIRSVADSLNDKELPKRAIFVLFDATTQAAFQRAWNSRFRGSET